ncbi:MAG: HipA domain-containing protein, partial [Bacteroidota bacterium]|nr:HipA domain-containing protein [Bacteroidota bacterium]
RILIFNFLTGNGDAHLKNFSLLETSDGDMQLSPSYDLINTKLHVNDSPIALNLFRELERTRLPKGQTYTYAPKALKSLWPQITKAQNFFQTILF